MQLFTLWHFRQHAMTETAVVVLKVVGNAIESAINLNLEPSTHKDNIFKAFSNVLSTCSLLISLR